MFALQLLQARPHRRRRTYGGQCPPYVEVVLAPWGARPVRQQVGVATGDERRTQPVGEAAPQPHHCRSPRARQQRTDVHRRGRRDRTCAEPPFDDRHVGLDWRREPIGPRAQQAGTEEPAQPGQLGAQGHRRHRLVLVQRAQQLVARQSLRVSCQQHQDLTVPAAEPDLSAARDQLGLVAAERGQFHRVGRCFRRCEQCQLGLGGPRHRLHETEAVRVREPVPARDVHRAEHPPRARIVHRRRGTRPGLDPADEVLGREHLHRSVHGDRRSRRVGADRRLRPTRARYEVHPPRLPPGRRMPLDPQQPALRVTHREEMLAVRRERPHELPEERHHPGQRMLRPVGAQVAVRELHPRRSVRRDTGPCRSPPGIGHHRAHRSRHRARLGEHLVRTAQCPHPLDGVGSCFECHPRFGQRGLPVGDAAETIVTPGVGADKHWDGAPCAALTSAWVVGTSRGPSVRRG